MSVKKIVLIIVAVALVFSITAIVSAVNNALLSSDKTVEVHKFDNSYYKLMTDKSLKIGYIGGSITVGTGSSDSNTRSWPALVSEWFSSKFPESEGYQIVHNNAGHGGHGSVYAQYRIIEGLKLGTEDQPDLIFLEFAINDGLDGTDYINAKKNLNTILKTIYQYNENTDVALVITTDSNKSERKLKYEDSTKSILDAHNEVAEAYGLPVIDVGNMLWDDMETEAAENGYSSVIYYENNELVGIWPKHFSDWVHPSNMGHLKYAGYITYYLDTVFSKKTEVPSGYVASYIPENADEICGTALVNPYSVMAANVGVPEGYSATGDVEGGIITTKTGVEFTVKFEGTSFGMWIKYAVDVGGAVDVIIDGDTENPIELNLYRVYESGMEENPDYGETKTKVETVVTDLANGTHTAKIISKASPSNESATSVTIDRFFSAGGTNNATITLQ